MKKRYITIDGGTTNTRVALVEDNKVLRAVKGNVGARKSMSGNDELVRFIKDAISDLLSEYSLCEDDITCVLASGMITSEFGLYELPHISAPAGAKELHDSIKRHDIPEICSLPFYFIPGVRLTGERLEDFDMMRGEETELFGLLEDPRDCVCVLPGSHSKIIVTDENGRITRFFTMLTGEMIAALSGNTILRDAVDLSISEIDEARLSEGCVYTLENGINEALFKVRVQKNLLGRAPAETYSFFIGAVLAGEIKKIMAIPSARIVLGGKSQLKTATASLLRDMCPEKITVADDTLVDGSTFLGQVKVFEYN
ncbi:MAG: 2-dehydro-3-deoxygalactonokinase [Clostridia bacterium]|nr:2-dehydro-3-deoxygalactonokinase [Clostridia bacterium]